MPETNDRFLNLATLNIGEALTEIANLRQRDKPPGADYRVAMDKLRRAIYALDGLIYETPVDPQHEKKGNPGS